MEILSGLPRLLWDSMIMPALCDQSSFRCSNRACRSGSLLDSSLLSWPSCGLLIPGWEAVLCKEVLDISSEILKWRGVIWYNPFRKPKGGHTEAEGRWDQELEQVTCLCSVLSPGDSVKGCFQKCDISEKWISFKVIGADTHSFFCEILKPWVRLWVHRNLLYWLIHRNPEVFSILVSSGVYKETQM